jgi:Bacterial low temperature requirement A protein (LtrA)
VLTALGVEGVLAHADAARPLGGFYAAALLGGAALYLAGELLFKQRMHRTLSLPRLVAAAGVLLAALPAVETARYAQARRSLRNP